jgi:hypothetical protein
MDGHLKSLRMLLPQRQQAHTVRIVAHDGLAVIAALDDVVGIACNGQAGLAGHRRLICLKEPV